MSINSIRNLVVVASQKTPNKVALIDKSGKMTYGEVYEKVNKLATYINTLDLPKGSRIGIYSNKNSSKVVSILAVLSTEYILVPITKLLKAEQVEYIIKDCDISCMITDEQKLKTLKETSFDGKIITVESCDKELVSFEEIYKCFKADYDCDIKGHDNAVITYSFASSGFPKGVVMSHKNLIDGARVVNSYLNIKEDDVLSGLLSFSFDYGLNQIFTSFYARATFAIHTFFTPSDFFSHILRDKVTVIGAMPVHFSLMFDEDPHRLPSSKQLENVRVITSSGANVTASMIEKIQTYFVNALFYSMSGHTEAFRSAYLEPAQLQIRPNSIGKAIPDVELYVVNDEGYECKPREVGQLIHRGAGIYKGFWNSKEDTNSKFKSISILENVIDLQQGLTDEVVVATGDYVYKDEEGYIFFVSRHDDMINTAGYRISPVEIETVVYNNIPQIKECAVFGIDNEKIEEEIVLVYSGTTELAKNEIIFELKKHLPSYMIPSQIIFKANMPMMISDKSKIDKKVLKEDILKNY
ncbi:MAG: AMP-binding protein [Campylobacterota bacterium]|nr:AMP-binding protein [Campylobacterota bacterium]